MQIKLIRKARRSVASLSRDTAIVCGVVALLVFVTFVTTVAIVAKGTTREKVVYNPAIWREQPRLSDVAIPLVSFQTNWASKFIWYIRRKAQKVFHTL